MPFLVDDAAIIAAAVQAAEAAAAAEAASAAMAASAAAGGEAGAGVMASAGLDATSMAASEAAMNAAAAQNAASAAATGSQAATTGATQASLADTLAQTANAAQGQLMPEMATGNFTAPGGVINTTVDTTMPAAQNAGLADLGAPIDVTPPPMVDGPVAGPPPGGAAAPGTAPPPSITDTMGEYAGKLGNTLVSPEFLLPLALQGIGSAMSYQGIDNGSDYVQETVDLAKDVVAGQQEKSNRAITDWGSDYLSPEAIQKNTDEAYLKLATDYVSNQDRAKQDLGGVVGNTPDEYAKAMAGASAGASQDAADYAKKLAKAQAPAFADLNTNIGEMKANRTTADALSDMRQTGATGYNALGAIPGDPKMLGGAALRGLGSGLGTILGK